MTTSRWIMRIRSNISRSWRARLALSQTRCSNCKVRIWSWDSRIWPMWRRCRWWESDMGRWKRAIRRWRKNEKLRKQLLSSRQWPHQEPQGQERMKGRIRLWWCLITRAQVELSTMKVRLQPTFISMMKFNKRCQTMNKMHRITPIWWFKVSTLELQMMMHHMLKGNSSSNLKSQFRTKELKKQSKKSLNRDKSPPKHMISL